MSSSDDIQKIFDDSIKTKLSAKEVLVEPIRQAVLLTTNALKAGNKILSCGNGKRCIKKMAAGQKRLVSVEQTAIQGLDIGSNKM